MSVNRQTQTAEGALRQDSAIEKYLKSLIASTTAEQIEPASVAPALSVAHRSWQTAPKVVGLQTVPNEGPGVFTELESVHTRYFSEFELIDFDGDGDLDAILDGNYSIFDGPFVSLNDGTGQFTASGFGKTWLNDMSVADLNGDGAMDLVLQAEGVFGEQLIAWIYDETAGSLPYQVVPIRSGLNSIDVEQILTVDWDGDGDVDIVTGSATELVSLWANDGAGNFQLVNHSLPRVAPDDRGRLALDATLEALFHDVDGDGDLDAVLPGLNAFNGHEVWINDGTGVFSDSGQIVPVTEILEFADLDGDGDLDVLAPVKGQNDTADIWLNDGSGVFTAMGQNLALTLVDLGDIDGDGDLDAIAISDSKNNVSVLLNDGTGTFTPGDQLYKTRLWNDQHYATLADLDGDGDLDVLGSDVVQDAYDVIWFNDGTGSFERGYQWLGKDYAYIMGPEIADVDGDGLADIVYGANYDDGYGSYLTVYTNDGFFGPNDDVFRIDDDGELGRDQYGNAENNVRYYDNGFGLDAVISPGGYYDKVTAINGVRVAVGQEIVWSNGAVMQLDDDGDLTFDPRGAYDYLPEGDIERLFFEYTMNGLWSATVAIVITGIDNDDVFEGTLEDDVIFAGVGNDQIIGRTGHDALYGETGNDLIYGENGRDTLDGGAGNDTLRGDAGSDLFIFSQGNDLVSDFDALDRRERIDLSNTASIRNFRDLKYNHMQQLGNDVVITDVEGNTMTIAGVSLSDLNREDFIF